MSLCNTLVASLLIAFLMFNVCESCERGQYVRGCRIRAGACVCGIICRSDFRFASRKECQHALKDWANPCEPNPCHNNGHCLQTTTSMSRFKCKCEGTGFYGPMCESDCGDTRNQDNFPHECIQI